MNHWTLAFVGDHAEQNYGTIQKARVYCISADSYQESPNRNVDRVVLDERGISCVETKSHKGQVSSANGDLLLNGRPMEKDFVKQTWRGCYRLREIPDADVTPLLLFTDAFVAVSSTHAGRGSCRWSGWSGRSWASSTPRPA